MTDPIEDLRQNIIKLKPDGEDGFEGLMAAVLSELTKRTFAIASAGSQHGKDGQSALDQGQIVFEAKRYDDDVQKDKIYTKIVEIAAGSNDDTELYIVGATNRVSTQIRDTLKTAGRQLSIAIEVFAWPDTGLSELAALLAMTPQTTAAFIARHTQASEAVLVSQMDAVRAHPQFQARADELRAVLQQPSIAPAFALADNAAWLKSAFSSKAQARRVFGQALSPSDPSISGTVDRKKLRERVAAKVFTKPDDTVIAILGADGVGKSWAFAQAWLHQANAPLTIVIVPDDIKDPPSPESCQDLLVEKLLTQTGDIRKTESRERWLRHFQRWRARTDIAMPRVVVFLDGINQRESVNWLRFIDTMSDEVAKLGGRLAFSCREVFYRDNLQNKLVADVHPIEVSEWTDLELNELLEERGTSISELDASIVRSLRNPRIFGVAAQLFKADEIKAFGELSVSRLLFEHIRSGGVAESASISPAQFSSQIRAHAARIVDRLKAQESDGINEFDMPAWTGPGTNTSISEQFVITSAGRFFEIVDDSSKYTLRDEGLPLALGLALVATAREAKRKGKSVDDALSNILDPIAALDRTGDILLAAIVAAVLERSPKEVVAPLVRSFVLLQNLDSARYPEFRSLFGRDPESFLAALEDAALARDVASNLSWLTDAVNDLRGDAVFEGALTAAIHRWLNKFSLSPERMVLIPNNAEHAAERGKQLAKRQKDLDAAVAALTQNERNLLKDMFQEERGDYSRLNLLAFQAVAGRPLQQYAASFRNWCFAASLNGGYYDHHDDFNDLLHFNLSDWTATRDALRSAAAYFREDGTSQTGRWALVYVLRATGDSDDAREAETIADDLTKDRERHKGWRRIEDYCATDPCDPASEKPANIDATATAYENIDVSQIRRFTSNTQDDHFFQTAQPGLARFRPDIAVGVLRALADQAITRTTPEFRQAVFMLENHTVGLEDRVAPSYVAKADGIAQEALDRGEDKNNESWVAAQYALSVAFPHMSGDAQFDALMKHPRDRTILLDLCRLFEPISAEKLEAALDEAVNEGNPVAQFRALCFAEYSRTPLTKRAKEIIISLLGSEDDHVRLSTLALIQATADPYLLSALVDSGWSAATLDAVSRKVEILHGSEALVLAAQQGMITIEACLDRIALSAYESLAKKLGREASLAIARRLTTAITKAAEYRVTSNLPLIEQNFEGPRWPVVYEVSEKPVENEATSDRFRRLAETGDAWYERQKRNESATDEFERELTKAGARLIIQSVTVDLIVEIDKAAQDQVNAWAELFKKLERKSLSNVHNIAAVVAEALSRRNAAAGIELFDVLKDSVPHVRVTFGRDKISLDSAAIWGAADSNHIRELRFSRLDTLASDHEIAMEVLAAIRADRIGVLRDYVLDRRQRVEPAYRARAAMVAGLSPDEPWAVETVTMLKDEHGFLLRAHQAAKYALERHQWTRHWAALMRDATDPVDLWRYAVLLSKIVDGRFKGAEVDGKTPTTLVRRFGVSLNDPIRHRINKWKSKRESKLFGMNAPNRLFLSRQL